MTDIASSATTGTAPSPEETRNASSPSLPRRPAIWWNGSTSIYAFSAIYFAPSFFPKADPTAQLLNTAGVFAAGFLMRPIGGWLFGRIADRNGRKNSMLISVR
jgi:MHS family alpha-ketoglutarate permease-like MFS transporter